MTVSVRNIFSKALALAILVGLAAVVALGLLFPALQRFRDANAQISTQRELLGRYLANAMESREVSSDLANSSIASAYIPGETDALRLANLQSTLNDAARAENIRLASSRAMDAGDHDGVRLLGIQAQLTTELGPLQRLLFALEKGRGGLMVDSLHVARGPDVGGIPSSNLDVTFVLLGAAPQKKEQAP